MRYADFYDCDICNGNQVGMSLFVQGCPFHCEGCFNPETWDFDGGKEWASDVRKRFMKLVERDYIKRISFLGGSPLCDENVSDVSEIITYIRANYPDKKIWVYTGLSWEDIYDESFFLSASANATPNNMRNNILQFIDVLVDGSFQCDKRDITLPFRGSTNQRIIDVPKSLEAKEVVLWKTDSQLS